MKALTILDVMRDPELLGKTFRKSLLHGDTWKPWRAFLSALFGLPMDGEAQEIFTARTGRVTLPAGPFGECFVIAGRRSGKSIVAALIAVFLACFKDYSDVLAPGETGVLMVLASDRRQSQIIFRYIDAFLSIPVLKGMVVDRYKESISLKNNVKIEVHTSSYKTVRGFTCVGCIADEVAFWSSETSVNPDREVLNAIRPSLATTGGLLLCISSPYGRRGVLWESFKQFYGKDDDGVLVWKGSSREMNPSLALAVVAKAYARDYSAAHAEYGAEFRNDIEGFLPADLIESHVIRGRLELPFDPNESYRAFCDPSGGIADSMTLAVAHLSNEKAILDCVREVKPPFSPESVVKEFSTLLKRYRCFEVSGDRYGGIWPEAEFQKCGILYRPSDKNKSEIYLEFLSVAMSGQCELLDHSGLIMQLSSLERKVTKFGRDSIDHGMGAHDDVGNAVAGVLVLVGASGGGELGFVNLLKKWGTAGADAMTGLFSRKPRETVATVGPAILEFVKPPSCKNCGQSRFDENCTGTPPQYRCMCCSAWTPAIAASTKLVSIEKKLCCPNCQNLSLTRSAGAPVNGFHCNNCGTNFLPDGTITSAAPVSEACEKSPTKLHVWRNIGNQKRCDYCGVQGWNGQPPNMTGQSRRAHFAPRANAFPMWDRLDIFR